LNKYHIKVVAGLLPINMNIYHPS